MHEAQKYSINGWLRTSACAGSAAATAATAATRVPPIVPERQTPQQKKLYERVLQSRQGVAAQVTNPDGSLVGPWNFFLSASPPIGDHLERLGNACRQNSAVPRNIAEVGILAVGARWQSQFE